MNSSADPCEDFYEYACGSCLRKQIIPQDHTSSSRSLKDGADNLLKELRELLEDDLQEDKHPNAIAGRFYTSFMKAMATGPLNVRILKKFRCIFNNLETAETFSLALATLHGAQSTGIFRIAAYNELNILDRYALLNPDRYALYIVQGNLGFTHPSVYTAEKPAFIKARTAYMQLIEGHLRVCVKGGLLKSQDIEELAKKTFEFEKSLASTYILPGEPRGFKPVQLDTLREEIFVHLYLQKIGIDKNKINNTVFVNPEYLSEIANMMARVSGDKDYREAVKGYLGFHLITHFARKGMMTAELYKDKSRFVLKINGVKTMSEKSKRCQDITSITMGDALKEAFMKNYFRSRRRQVADKITKEITSAFRESLSHQEWMDYITRSRALEKLKAINWKVGYTSQFDEYPGLVLSKPERDYGENLLNIMEYWKRNSIERFGKPRDKTQWFKNSHEMDACYTRNTVVLPAGILQQPFFSDVYPDAMNYGGIGTVIGHEMSHAFDDHGRLYDKDGRLVSWWSFSSATNYEDKAQCFVELFNSYKPRSVETYVDGHFTLNENLADTNGVKVAFQALKTLEIAMRTLRFERPIMCSLKS